MPQSLNPQLPPRRRQRRATSYYTEGVLAGDRVVLSRAMTLVESTLPADREQAHELLDACLPHTGRSFRLGITGVPGVGKSTFIETFGLLLLDQGYRPAVLTIDPSSQLTRGSILGDKTRMARLARREEAYIRPSAAGDSLGGVAAKTRELILLCEAAGFDFIIVETVGVGQSEVAVHALTDFFLLLLLPGGGDELQGIKRGVVEMADLIAVNKADGERRQAAREARADYARALHLFPPKESGWTARAVTCSATTGEGVEAILGLVTRFREETLASGYLNRHRQEQARHWLHETIREALLNRFYQDERISHELPRMEKAVREGQQSPLAAAEQLLALLSLR
jgi:LAO/AO transport system kinase